MLFALFEKIIWRVICYLQLFENIYLDPTLTLSHNKDKGLDRHSLDLFLRGSNKDIGKYSFKSRVHKMWNNLPEEVATAKDVLAFEIGLDKHWANQELMYDNFKAAIVTKSRGSRANNI